MSTLFDLNHYFGGDLSLSNSGDIATVNGTLRGQQRVLRRLLTNPGAYIWQPEYGAGLPQWIGRTLDIPKIQGLILAQMLLEDAVAKTPLPTVSVRQAPNDFSAILVQITYADQPTLVPVTLSFTVS